MTSPRQLAESATQSVRHLIPLSALLWYVIPLLPAGRAGVQMPRTQLTVALSELDHSDWQPRRPRPKPTRASKMSPTIKYVLLPISSVPLVRKPGEGSNVVHYIHEPKVPNAAVAGVDRVLLLTAKNCAGSLPKTFCASLSPLHN